MGRLSGLMTACILILAACKNGTLQQESPARIENLGPSGHAELQGAVSEVLDREVLLSRDAFSESSTLIVERRAHRDPQGNRLPGRELGRPEKFQLILSGGKCILVQESSGRRRELKEVQCAPE